MKNYMIAVSFCLAAATTAHATDPIIEIIGPARGTSVDVASDIYENGPRILIGLQYNGFEVQTAPIRWFQVSADFGFAGVDGAAKVDFLRMRVIPVGYIPMGNTRDNTELVRVAPFYADRDLNLGIRGSYKVLVGGIELHDLPGATQGAILDLAIDALGMEFAALDDESNYTPGFVLANIDADGGYRLPVNINGTAMTVDLIGGFHAEGGPGRAYSRGDIFGQASLAINQATKVFLRLESMQIYGGDKDDNGHYTRLRIGFSTTGPDIGP